MMIKHLAKRIVTYACVGALVAGSLTGINGYDVSAAEEAVISDSLALTELVNTWDQGTEESGYTYLGNAGCEATSDYKYLKITYTGDSTALDLMRWGFNDSDDQPIGTFWFRENQEGTIKTVDGTEVAAPTSEEQTAIIDFSKSGIDTTYGIYRVHLHGEKGKGAINITSAEFLKSVDTGVQSKDDIVLNGDETGQSAMIGKYTAPGREPSDDYKYLGFATLKEATVDYRYLVLTYTGNITQLRFQFEENVDGVQNLQGPFWFNKEGQENYFVTADGSDIPLEGNETTVVIDLVASGVDLDKYNYGVHMHCDLMATHGNFEIGYARLSTSAELKDVDAMPQEVPSEVPSETPSEDESVTNSTLDKNEKETVKVGKSKIRKAYKKIGSKKLKVTFKKVKKADGYRIQVSNKKSFKKVLAKRTVKKGKVKNVKVSSKRLKNKKKLFVRVRAYKLVGTNKVWGEWSKAKKVTVK